MANLNKVMLIGRLTRDPEVRTFSNGGKVAKFGFAVNNRQEEPADGPVGRRAGLPRLRGVQPRRTAASWPTWSSSTSARAMQVFIEGHLSLDQWTDKNDGEKRSKLKIVVDNVQFLERRQDGGDGDGGSAAAGRAQPPARDGRRRRRRRPTDGSYDDRARPCGRAGGGGDGGHPFLTDRAGDRAPD